MEFDKRWPRRQIIALLSVRLAFALLMIPLIVAIDAVNDIFYNSALLLAANIVLWIALPIEFIVLVFSGACYLLRRLEPAYLAPFHCASAALWLACFGLLCAVAGQIFAWQYTWYMVSVDASRGFVVVAALLVLAAVLVHVYSAILSIVVWQRVSSQPREAYELAVENAAAWYGQPAVEAPVPPSSPPPMWTPLGSAPESLVDIPNLNLKDVAEGEKALLKPEP